MSHESEKIFYADSVGVFDWRVVHGLRSRLCQTCRRFKSTAQRRSLQSRLNNHAAAIICDNASSNATVIPAKKAREAGIPTFMIDREITEKDIAISQIVANNYQGTKGIAEAFVEAMGEQGTYAALLGKESDTHADVRSAAFHEVITNIPI